MSESTSLYRRHRPGSFDEVVGQQHVVRTLRNAVEQGKVHHAYLFVGSRGTGARYRGPAPQGCNALFLS